MTKVIRSKGDKETIKASASGQLVTEGDTSDEDLYADVTEKHPGEAGKANKS